MLERAVCRPGARLTPPAPPHYDARTPEYAVFPEIRRDKWESVRGMDKSFGYNRTSREEDFIGHDELVHSLVDIVSKNGNLLLNVGPRGEDTAIPEPQLRRLEWLGDWTSRYGEALRGTRPWRRAEGRTREGLPLRFTARGDTCYAVVLGRPEGGELGLVGLGAAAPASGGRLALVGGPPLRWRREGEDLVVTLPESLPPLPAHALVVEGGGTA